jgi:hypothetical protein
MKSNDNLIGGVVMNKLFTLSAGVILGAATGLLLFVILGSGLGTAFIAGGVVFGAGVLGAGMIAAGEQLAILDAPLTSVGLLAGVAAFAVLEIVLSVPMWIGVMTGLSVIGLYDIVRAVLLPARIGQEEAITVHRPLRAPASRTNGQSQHDREPVGAR